MLVIKCTATKEIPKDCTECVWFECRPHPHKGWSDSCGLMSHCLDDDQPKEWVWGGDGRPDACPLIDVPEEGESESND